MLTKEFIHVHIPRTGGQQTRLIVSHAGPPVHHWMLTHLTVRDARTKLEESFGKSVAENAKAFCFVRNPFDWYVSRFFFRAQRDHWENEEVVPADFWKNGEGNFRKHMEMLKHAIDTGTPILGPGGEPAETRTYDPITLSGWHYNMTDGGVDHIGRFENFLPELTRILTSISGMQAADIQRIGARKVNASQHRDYRDYYDDEMRQWVAEWDARYIEEFGYEF